MSATDLRKQLQNINNAETNLIMQTADEETGEIPENVFEKLEKLGNTKIAIINSAVESYNQFTDFEALIKSRIDRLTALRKVYATTTSSIKNILSKELTENGKINAENYMISWRKSESVEVDEFISLKEIEKEHPSLVVTVKTLNKTETKKLLKQGIEVEGASLRTKFNIQIK